MTLLSSIRNNTLAALFVMVPATVLAQRGGGGPGGGGPGGGGPGGAMGAPGGPGSMHSSERGMENRGAGSSGAYTPRYAPTLGPPGRWWDDHKIAKNLNIRNDQQRKMDDIFEAGKGNLLQLYSNLQREEGRLATMSKEDLADENKVFAAIDRVAQARAEAVKANAHILLQIRKELDAQQLATLDKELASR